MLVGEGRHGDPRRHAELGENVGHVPVYGPLAEEQRGCDLAVAPPGRHQLEHLDLALGQTCRRCGAATSVRDGLRVPVGTEPVEHGIGGIQLHEHCIVVRESSVRVCEQQPGLRCLVRCFDLLPSTTRLT